MSVRCEYCGTWADAVHNLTANMCMRHPDGAGKGRHSVYEGSEKNRYECVYCGQGASTISDLTSGQCMRHPDGGGKGRHKPRR